MNRVPLRQKAERPRRWYCEKHENRSQQCHVLHEIGFVSHSHLRIFDLPEIVHHERYWNQEGYPEVNTDNWIEATQDTDSAEQEHMPRYTCATAENGTPFIWAC